MAPPHLLTLAGIDRCGSDGDLVSPLGLTLLSKSSTRAAVLPEVAPRPSFDEFGRGIRRRVGSPKPGHRFGVLPGPQAFCPAILGLSLACLLGVNTELTGELDTMGDTMRCGVLASGPSMPVPPPRAGDIKSSGNLPSARQGVEGVLKPSSLRRSASRCRRAAFPAAASAAAARSASRATVRGDLAIVEACGKVVGAMLFAPSVVVSTRRAAKGFDAAGASQAGASHVACAASNSSNCWACASASALQ